MSTKTDFSLEGLLEEYGTDMIGFIGGCAIQGAVESIHWDQCRTPQDVHDILLYLADRLVSGEPINEH